MNILVLNGPNLHLLGNREPDIYGDAGLDRIMERVVAHGKKLGVEVDAFQSNEEGVLVTRIGESEGRYDGLIVNPAAYTHTSVALRDAIRACGLPCIEVHLSNTLAREPFRHVSLTAPVCIGQITGLGGHGYVLALDALTERLQKAKEREQ